MAGRSSDRETEALLAELAVVDIDALRAWAKRRGIVIPTRGRLPAGIVARYVIERAATAPAA